jgi:hypothetical protein
MSHSCAGDDADAAALVAQHRAEVALGDDLGVFHLARQAQRRRVQREAAAQHRVAIDGHGELGAARVVRAAEFIALAVDLDGLGLRIAD